MTSTQLKFLSKIFAELPTEEAAIQVYAYEQGGSWPKPKRFTSAEDAAKYADANPDKNIFFNCALMAKGEKRGTSKDARIVPVLFADLDADEGEHHGDRASKAELMAMLQDGFDVPPPSLIVDSGGGYHAYWLLDTPLTDMDQASSMLLELNNRIKAWHDAKGYKYERLKDLARVLRIPATFNHKTAPPRDVQIAWPIGTPITKYTAKQLTFKPLEVERPAAKTKTTATKVTADFDGCDSFDQNRAQEMAFARCMKIEQEWNVDASGYVIKCCRQCVRSGCDAETTVSVLAAVREKVEFPGDWTPEKIKMRYESALEQTELGSAAEETYRPTDHGIARRVVSLLDGRAVYVREWKKWVSWNGKNFDVGDDSLVMEALIQTTETMLGEGPQFTGDKDEDKEAKAWATFCMNYQSNRAFHSVENYSRRLASSSFMELDRRIDLFHCENKTLRLNDDGTVTAIAHDPAARNTQVSDVAYMPEAKCPLWDKFIAEVTCNSEGKKSPELVDYLQRIVGFCLTGRTDDQSLYILHGDGNNGKGAFCRTLIELLGGFGIAVQQSLLMESRKSEHLTQFASIYGKRCIITQETDQGCKLNEAQVKMLTGSDHVRCRRMCEDEWQFKPTHKVLMATNNLPIIRGTDNGIWRRVKLIPFAAKVVPDTTLEPKLLLELPGILNWAIEGYRKVCQEGGFIMPAEVERAKAEYRDDMDIVKQFVEEKCILAEGLETTHAVLYANLDMYCKDLGLHTPSAKKMCLDLNRLGCTNGRRNRERFKVGIGIADRELIAGEGPDLFPDDV